MTRWRCVHIFLAAVIALGVTLPAEAQNTGSIRGVVSDASAAIVPGATVVITSDALIGSTREAQTNELGVFRFPSVPVGLYVVDVTMPGFKPAKITGVSVSLGGTANVDVQLQIAVTTENVSVVGESPVVDVTTSTVAANIKGELLEEVPTRRNMYDLIHVQAGMSVDYGDGQSDRVVAHGSNRQSNSWNIDGVEVSGPETGSSWWDVNPDVIEEIQVLGVGAPAEYGNHTGGVFNVVTKSGSNTFKGAASYFFTNDSLTDTNVRLPDSPFVFHREKFANATAQLGGPLIRDKTWFFTSWEYKRDASTEPGNDPNFAPEVYSDNFDVKVTTRIGDKHDVNGFYHYERFGSPEVPSPFITPSALAGEYGHNPAWGAGWQTALSDRLLLDFRYAGWWSDDVYQSQTGSIEEPFTDYTPAAGGPATQSGGVDYTWDYVTWRQQAKAKATYYAQSFLKSQHEFKLGFQYSKGSAVTNLGIGPLGTYLYSYYGYLYRAVQDPYQYGGVTQDLGVFVDDNITVGDRLTLNLGVRFDHNTGEIPDYKLLTIGTPSISPAGNFQDTGQTLPGVDVVNWNLVSPRLGFAYKPRADGRSVIRGSFGVYYDHNVIGNWDVPAPGRPARHYFTVDPVTLENIEEFNTIGEGQISISPDLKAPRTLQTALGYEQQVLGTLALGVQYVYKTTKDLVGWEILGGVYEPFPFTDPFTGREYTLLSQIENPVIRKGNDPGTFPGAESLDYFQRYHGVVFTFNRRYANNWGLSGSYTWSRSEGLIPTMLSQFQFNPLYGATAGSDPNNFVNAEGRLQGDRPHMFRVQGVVLLPYDIQLSTASEFSSGRAFNRQINVGGLGQGRKTVIMEPGGSHRFPNIENVDVTVGKIVRLGSTFRLRLDASVFNLLNSEQNLTFADLRLQSPEDDFVADTWVKPRTLQFRVGVQF